MKLLVCYTVAMAVTAYLVVGQQTDQGTSQFDCQTYQFTCMDGSRKIPSHSLCDGSANCDDGSDEIQDNCAIDCAHSDPPFSVDCATRTFTCTDGSAAGLSELCDNFPDCSDGSDEVAANCRNYCPIAPAHGAAEKKIRNKRAIPLALLKFLFFKGAGTMDQIAKMLRGDHNTTPKPGEIM